ncbi:MAG: ShlB/FhaC/HecB family hemolysin secretion/activation protein [Methylophilaceae bacterium]
MRLITILILLISASLVFAGEPVIAEPTLSEPAKEKNNFDVIEYRVEGNTVLAREKIEESVYPFLGETKTVEDVELARAALEKTFHDAGYLTVFVNIPEQDVGKGVVTLQVQEGKVERLRVLGSRYYSLGVIKERVGEFAEGTVPYFPAVQKQLASINASPDRQVAPVLRPGKTPGKVEVDLKVQDKLPLHGNLELNDRYSYNTTETRLNGSLRYANLWQRDHSIGISFQVAPENTDEVKVLSATYVIPTLAGNYWAAYAVASRSNIAAVGDISVIGNGNIYGLRYINPLPALTGYSHSFTAGVDYKDFKENVTFGSGTNLGVDINTPIKYMPFLLGYDATLATGTSNTQLGLNATFSIRGLGNRSQEFANKRFLAQPDFAYLRATLKHTQQIYQGWKVVGRVAGQVSNDPLIANEQFIVGGADSVRGYFESNSFGDQGAYGSLELRTPSFAQYLPKNISELYALGFYDAGHVRLMDPLPSQTATFTLESSGVGFALKGFSGFFASLDYAKVRHDAGFVAKGDDRVHFRIGYDW